MLNSRRHVLLAALPLAPALSACVENFEVLVVNRRQVPAQIEIAQFHAPGFTTEPPAVFTSKELIQQDVVMLKPGEQRSLIYNSGAGGFWLQWRMLDPLPEPNLLHRLDLIRDSRRIVMD